MNISLHSKMDNINVLNKYSTKYMYCSYKTVGYGNDASVVTIMWSR